MASYFQMGHHTEGVVTDQGLEMYRGVILSPVNKDRDGMFSAVKSLRKVGNVDIILDPQLYSPRSFYGHLPTHDYYPIDIDTADLTSRAWWGALAKSVANYAAELGIDAVCSPAVLPKKWDDAYYGTVAESFLKMAEALNVTRIRPVMTVCVRIEDMTKDADALRIASILSSARPDSCYLVIESDLEPRREFRDADSLKTIMRLIAALEKSGTNVTVSHCCSDMILYKAAGATHCATGKAFNLRRFTKNRFEEKDDGGRQIAYWFEHSLLAFLRVADIAALRRELTDLFGSPESVNKWGVEILEQFQNDPEAAWLALSWRQYLVWFGTIEARLSTEVDVLNSAAEMIKNADANWAKVEEADLIFDERKNEGGWVRSWRQALRRFERTSE